MRNIFFIIYILIFSANTFGVDAKVLITKGTNHRIDEDGNGTPLKKGDFLLEGHALDVGMNGIVILKIDNHSVIRVEQGTRIDIDELPYFYQGSTKELEHGASLTIQYGTVLINMLNKFDNKSMKIKSKNIILGVRGTKFLVSKSKNTDDLLLSVNKGLVQVNNNSSKDVEYVAKDESIIVEKGKHFTKRQKYNFQKKIDWNISRIPKKTFADIRPIFRKEFKLKRKNWVANKKRSEKFKRIWQVRKQNWKNKVRNLKNSPQRKMRMDRIKNLRQLRKRELELSKGQLKGELQATRQRKRGLIRKNRVEKIQKKVQNIQKKTDLIRRNQERLDQRRHRKNHSKPHN